MDDPQLRIAARRKNDGEPLTPTQNAWLACVERVLPDAPTSKYSKAKLEALAKQVSQIVRVPSAFASLPRLYAQTGVRLVYVEAFPSSRLYGASFLLDDGPVIALSGLRQRLDIVLFTLLHETAHILRGDLERCGGSIIDEEDNPHTLGNEKHTDELAAQWMLPAPMPQLHRRVSQQWIEMTAEALGVHPIVIVGRLQRLEVLPWRTTLVKNAPNVIPYLQAWQTS